MTSRARPRSVAIMIGLRERRSTQAPAASPNRKPGSSWAMRSTPRAAGDASSRRMAVKGRAVPVMSDPKVETVAAPHRLTNLAFRQRPPFRMMDAMPVQTRGRELRAKNQPRRTGVLFTTRAERLSRTSPRYAYASPNRPVADPVPDETPQHRPPFSFPVNHDPWLSAPRD